MLDKKGSDATKAELIAFAAHLGIEVPDGTKAEILSAIEGRIGPYDPHFHPAQVEGTAEWEDVQKFTASTAEEAAPAVEAPPVPEPVVPDGTVVETPALPAPPAEETPAPPAAPDGGN